MKLNYSSFMFTFSLLISGTTIAEPWIGTDDVYLRNAIEQLSNHGIIKRPVNTYPLMWQGIAQDLKAVDHKQLSHELSFALTHVSHALKFAQKTHVSGIKIKTNSEPDTLQSFGERYQEEAAIQGYNVMMGDRVTAKVAVQASTEANNNKDLVYDDSYMAILFANWVVSVEQINRWWGPANDNALLLSNNASPMPGIRFSRVNTDYYGPQWLSFIGAWNFTTLLTQQKHHVIIDKKRITRNNKFFAARFSAKPIAGLELALSQSAQFDGKNQGHDLSDYSNVFIGHNKRNDETGLNEYNQLISFDFKYATTSLKQNFALYGELAGSQNNNLIPENKLYTAGIESFFGSEDYLIKTYLEYSDTTANCAENNKPHCSYKHPNFDSGYYQYQQNIGPNISKNAKSLTLAANYHKTNGIAAFAKLRYLKQNSYPISTIKEETKRIQFDLGYQQGIFNGLAKVSISAWKEDKKVIKTSDTKTAIQASWEYRF